MLELMLEVWMNRFVFEFRIQR